MPQSHLQRILLLTDSGPTWSTPASGGQCALRYAWECARDGCSGPRGLPYRKTSVPWDHRVTFQGSTPFDEAVTRAPSSLLPPRWPDAALTMSKHIPSLTQVSMYSVYWRTFIFCILRTKMYITENLEITERYKNIRITCSHTIQN